MERQKTVLAFLIPFLSENQKYPDVLRARVTVKSWVSRPDDICSGLEYIKFFLRWKTYRSKLTIIHPTRITPNSKTLIDNIFSNSPTFSEGISGNITLSISDHLAQFLIIPMNFGYVLSKIYLYKRDTKNFDREIFLLDLLDIDWSLVIKLEKEDPNYSFNLYENTLNTLLDKYIPLRKITQKELKQQYKPWITNDILKSIKARENLYIKIYQSKR